MGCPRRGGNEVCRTKRKLLERVFAFFLGCRSDASDFAPIGGSHTLSLMQFGRLTQFAMAAPTGFADTPRLEPIHDTAILSERCRIGCGAR